MKMHPGANLLHLCRSCKFGGANKSLRRNVNGNIDSAKYQSDIIHDNEMTCECGVFLQKDIFLCMISHHAKTLKVLEYS